MLRVQALTSLARAWVGRDATAGAACHSLDDGCRHSASESVATAENQAFDIESSWTAELKYFAFVLLVSMALLFLVAWRQVYRGSIFLFVAFFVMFPFWRSILSYGMALIDRIFQTAP